MYVEMLFHFHGASTGVQQQLQTLPVMRTLSPVKWVSTYFSVFIHSAQRARSHVFSVVWHENIETSWRRFYYARDRLTCAHIGKLSPHIGQKTHVSTPGHRELAGFDNRLEPKIPFYFFFVREILGRRELLNSAQQLRDIGFNP